MLLSMSRFQIIGTKRCQAKTIQHLHRLGAVQIDVWSEARSFSQQHMIVSDEAIHLRERLAYMGTRVEAVLAALPALELPLYPEYEDY